MTEIEILRRLLDCIGDEDDWLYRDIVKLIQRQDEEIEHYKRVARYQQSSNMARWFEIKRLEEEIERLKANKHGGIVH